MGHTGQGQEREREREKQRQSRAVTTLHQSCGAGHFPLLLLTHMIGVVAPTTTHHHSQYTTDPAEAMAVPLLREERVLLDHPAVNTTLR